MAHRRLIDPRAFDKSHVWNATALSRLRLIEYRELERLYRAPLPAPHQPKRKAHVHNGGRTHV